MNSGQLKKIPETLFHLHVEEVDISAMEGRKLKLHLWSEK